MYKQTALILAAALAAGGAFAQQVLPTPASAFVAATTEVQGSKLASVPIADAVEADRDAGQGGAAKGQRRIRKEYPNVMGMSLTAWLGSRPNN